MLVLRSLLLLSLVAACAGGTSGSATADPPPPPPPGAPCRFEEPVCILQGAPGAKYEELAVTGKADLVVRGKGEPGQVEFVMEVARASLFVNGRYVGTTPFRKPVEIPAGKNDIHIRAGRELVTKGVLTVPEDEPMRIKVRRR